MATVLWTLLFLLPLVGTADPEPIWQDPEALDVAMSALVGQKALFASTEAYKKGRRILELIANRTTDIVIATMAYQALGWDIPEELNTQALILQSIHQQTHGSKSPPRRTAQALNRLLRELPDLVHQEDVIWHDRDYDWYRRHWSHGFVNETEVPWGHFMQPWLSAHSNTSRRWERELLRMNNFSLPQRRGYLLGIETIHTVPRGRPLEPRPPSEEDPLEYPTKQEPVRFTGYDCSRPAGLHFHTLPLEEECIPVGRVTGAEEHSFKIWRLEPPQPLPARKCSLHRTSLLIHCPSDQLLILEPEGTSFHEIIPVTPEECNEYHETKEYRIRQFILPQLQETLRFQVGINQTFHLFYDSRGRVSWGDQPLQCPGSRWWSAQSQTFLPDHIQLVHDELVLEEDKLHHQGQKPLPVRLRSQKEGRTLGKLCEPSQLSCQEKGVTWTWSRPVHDCRLSPLAYGQGQLFQFYHLGDWIRLIWDHGRGLPFLFKGWQEICGRTLIATEWPSLFLDPA